MPLSFELSVKSYNLVARCLSLADLTCSNNGFLYSGLVFPSTSLSPLSAFVSRQFQQICKVCHFW